MRSMIGPMGARLLRAVEDLEVHRRGNVFREITLMAAKVWAVQNIVGLI